MKRIEIEDEKRVFSINKKNGMREVKEILKWEVSEMYKRKIGIIKNKVGDGYRIIRKKRKLNVNRRRKWWRLSE